jgi:triacylglycerol lipase
VTRSWTFPLVSLLAASSVLFALLPGCAGDDTSTAAGAPANPESGPGNGGNGGSTDATDGGAGESSGAGATSGDGGSATSAEDDLKANDQAVGFSKDFKAFLAEEGSGLDQVEFDGPAGYGGKTKAGQKLKHKPLILVHGNSDQAVGGKLGGWSGVIDGFKKAGYTSAEIYAVSWGPADSYQAVYQYHSKEYLTRVRAFIQAVLAYTEADKADVVGHSMGVTLARKAIVGGDASDALAGGAYDLGPALTDRIDTFVGIAGGNRGLSTCYFTGPSTPTCGATNGFYPGSAPGFGLSLFLGDLLLHPHEEAGWVGSIWSPDDEILGTGSLTWGLVTARIPEQDGELVLDGQKHLDLKNASIPALLSAVSNHTFESP